MWPGTNNHDVGKGPEASKFGSQQKTKNTSEAVLNIGLTLIIE